MNLTPRQLQIVKAIKALQELSGCSPTLQELGAAVGLRSLATVDAHIKKLQAKGWIGHAYNETRDLRILKPIPAEIRLCCPHCGRDFRYQGNKERA
jgi:SOS-response transcriptional repressor LexA